MDWLQIPQDDTTNATTPYRTKFNDPHGEQPCIAIATALARLEETRPGQTNFVLADEIDADALNDLLTVEANDVTVTFTMDDYRVVARSNGKIEIRVA